MSDSKSAPPYSPAQKQLRDMQRHLAAHPDVDMAEIDTSRFPERLCVTIKSPDIPDGVHDVLEEYEGTITNAAASTASDGVVPWLIIELTAEVPFRDAGTRDISTWGKTSPAITIPREAMDVSGFEVGTKLELDGRDGELRLTRRDD